MVKPIRQIDPETGGYISGNVNELEHGGWTLEQLLDYATKNGLCVDWGTPVRELLFEIDCAIVNMEQGTPNSGYAEGLTEQETLLTEAKALLDGTTP